MPEYRFRICRNVTESAEVTIAANSIEEAQEAAIRDHMNPSFGWQLDEANHHEAYIPDSDGWEEVEDGLGRLFENASYHATPTETERKNK